MWQVQVCGETVSHIVILVFSTQLCELLSVALLPFSLVQLSHLSTFPPSLDEQVYFIHIYSV
jgi:hypothetical protein